MIVIEVRDAELMSAIRKQAVERGISNAVIVSLIGAVDSFTAGISCGAWLSPPGGVSPAGHR